MRVAMVLSPRLCIFGDDYGALKKSTVVPSALPWRFMNKNIAGGVWGGLAAMLVALPSAIAFGVTVYAP